MPNPNLRTQSQYARATAGGLSYGNINADPMQHFGRTASAEEGVEEVKAEE